MTGLWHLGTGDRNVGGGAANWLSPRRASKVSSPKEILQMVDLQNDQQLPDKGRKAGAGLVVPEAAKGLGSNPQVLPRAPVSLGKPAHSHQTHRGLGCARNLKT